MPRRMQPLRLVLLFSFGVVAACGGKVVADGGAEAGASATGSGGAASSSIVGASTSATGGAGGVVGTSVAASTAVVSSTAASTGTSVGVAPPAMCPSTPPNQGAACDMPGLTCPIPYSCCGVDAYCDPSGHWDITAVDCEQPCISCGPNLECQLGAVCVATQVDALVEFRCDKDPCSPNPVDCSCAAPVCNDQIPGACQSTMGFTVNCETFTN